MKLFKSLLLASATGMVAVSGASAADLGAKKPSPVEYVKACYNPLWGTSGGFVIPGGNTCLRVFGQARFDMQYNQQFNRASAPLGWRGGMTVGLDAVTPSEYGNVRAFASIGAMYRSGSANQRSGTNARLGFAFDNVSVLANTAAQTELNYTGFVQFAGITAGRTASFFRTVGQPVEIIGLTYMSGPGNVNTIAYSASLGNGFLATVALEDPTTRRHMVADLATPVYAGAGPFGLARTAIRMPNAIASLRVDQAWGSAEVAGMLNEVSIANAPILLNAGTKMGYSISAGAKINLPMIAAGDALYLNGTYAKGNISAVMSNGIGSGQAVGGTRGIAAVTPDSSYDAVLGHRLTTAWGVTAGFQHFWTPALSSSIYASYASINVPTAPGIPGLATQLRDSKWLTLGVTNIWTPVRGLAIGLENAWVKETVQGLQNDSTRPGFVTSNGSQFLTRLRITRDF
jgi:Porin subfamily